MLIHRASRYKSPDKKMLRSLPKVYLLLAIGLARFDFGLSLQQTTLITNNSAISNNQNDAISSFTTSSNPFEIFQNSNENHLQIEKQSESLKIADGGAVNQNLIMSPLSSIDEPIPVTAALTGGVAAIAAPAPGLGGQILSNSNDGFSIPYPPSSISATSTMFHNHNHHTSGSTIKSFDSSNVIDDKQQQHQHQQQQHQQHYLQQLPQQQQLLNEHQLQQYTQFPKSAITRPAHKVVGIGNSNSKGMNAAIGIGGGGGGGSGVSGGGSSIQGSSSFADNHLDEQHNSNADDVFNTPMYFGTENSTVISTQIGAAAHIPCTVHHIGDGVVSWIRRKDYHLLTVGLTTYSSDERFSATHLKGSEDWTLQIKFVQLRDAGVYECQVSTHPPTSIFLHLNVVEARAEISGPPIRYLTPGSTLRLQCRVVQNTEASEYIFWYHDNRMINYDIDRGINVSTEPDFQSSELTILRTRREHSGNFTCVASNTQPASVLVHIFKGDNPAAMYHGHVGSSNKSYQTHMHHYMALLAIGYRILRTNLHIKIV